MSQNLNFVDKVTDHPADAVITQIVTEYSSLFNAQKTFDVRQVILYLFTT